MSEKPKQKAKKLLKKFHDPILCEFMGQIRIKKHTKACAIICCEEVMFSVVLHGAKWHEYNEIKNELLKM